jgi:16S rRNA (cytosine967-C5)-methyltransferase
LKKPQTTNPRLLAINALSDVLDEGINLAESSSLRSTADSRDVSLGRHLAYGVLRWLTPLEWLAAQMLKKPIKQKDRDIHRLILLGLHQMWKDETPSHAAIHETAECARHLGKTWAVAMINAVLRRFQREHEVLLGRLNEQVEQHAHPGWMLAKIQQDWPQQWHEIVLANNQQADLWLRLKVVESNRSDLIKRIEAEGFQTKTHPVASDGLRVSPAAQVHALPGFKQGHLSVQDPAAQLAADLLATEAGMHVLDACAAPGGKTGHILERTPDITMTATDLSQRRLNLIRENLDRLQLDADLVKADAAEPDAWWDGKPFQRILLDAPCSATGVIRRHPEIKHLRQTGQVKDVIALQQRLLQQLWPLLDVNGILVYATCSIFQDENSNQINRFLKQQANAEEQPISATWGQQQQFGRQILPGEQEMDGFYYAVLRKIS